MEPLKGVCNSKYVIACRFATMLREKEDTELKPVTTEGDTTFIYVKVIAACFLSC